MNKSSLLIIIISSFITYFSSAQNKHFVTGLLDTPDEEIIKANVQLPMTEVMYRSTGTKVSIKQYAPTPKDQSEYGTCAAWAVGYCARTIVEAYRMGITDKVKINAIAFSPIFVFRMNKGDEKRNEKEICSGANVGLLCKTMQEVGIPYLEELPDLCLTRVSDIKQTVKENAKKNKIDGFLKLWYEDNMKKREVSINEKVKLVKLSINNGKPVVISQFTTDSFNDMPKTGYWKPLQKEIAGTYSGKHGRHAMCIVGYDDSILGGAFEVQNSWGSNWGNGGYFWLSYDNLDKYVYGAIELQSMPPLESNEKVSFSGGFSLNLSDNTPMPAIVDKGKFKLKDAYSSGTRFRMYIENNQPAYVYAFGADGTFKTFQIFPHLDKVSPLLDYKKSMVAIPSEDHTVRMDGTVGTDYFCVLYSKLPLNINDIRQKIELQEKTLTFEQKIVNVLGKKIISNAKYSIDKDGFMRFEATGDNEESIVSIITEMKHVL